ncbi:hypothetical protein MTO96_047314 [Rhipicephalus appendiculatus]
METATRTDGATAECSSHAVYGASDEGVLRHSTAAKTITVGRRRRSGAIDSGQDYSGRRRRRSGAMHSGQDDIGGGARPLLASVYSIAKRKIQICGRGFEKRLPQIEVPR